MREERTENREHLKDLYYYGLVCGVCCSRLVPVVRPVVQSFPCGPERCVWLQKVEVMVKVVMVNDGE